MAIFPGAVATDSNLYVAVNQKSTTLTDNPLSNSATTVNVTSTSGFPSVGYISIDAEIIKYTGTTGTSFTGCTRGADGTTANTHVLGATVYHNVVADHHNASKDEIKAVEQFISDLLGLSNTQIKAPSGSVTTPSHSFSAATSSGLFNRAGTEVNIASNGTELFRVSQANALVSILGSTDLAIPSGRILYLDGGSNTYISESTADRIELTTGGTVRFRLDNSGFLNILATDVYIASVKRLYLDGGSDTYISESTGNRLSFVTGNTEVFRMDATTGFVSVLGVTDFSIPTLRGLYLDGGGDTLIKESSANVISFVAGGNEQFKIQNGNLTVVDTGAGLEWTRATYDTMAWEQAGTGFKLRNTTDGRDEIQLNGSGGVAIRGTVTNDNAAAGFVGEYNETNITTLTNFPTSGQFGDFTSISLTAGDWDVTAIGEIQRNGATADDYILGISTTSGNSGTGLTIGLTRVFQDNSVNGLGFFSLITPTVRLSLSTTTTVYFKYFADYATATPKLRGGIKARRVR